MINALNLIPENLKDISFSKGKAKICARVWIVAQQLALVTGNKLVNFMKRSAVA
jgi:hypothetical protein